MIIGHYDTHIWAKGGVATYIRRVSAAQRHKGHQIYYFTQQPCIGKTEEESSIVVRSDSELFEQAKQRGLDILHLHRGVAIAPPNDLTAIRTLHGHAPYCPSGSRFLKRWSQPCDRPYSPHGCLWGHFVDHCGSVRPQHIQQHFQIHQQEQATLPHIPTIAVSHFLKQQMVRSGYPANLIHVLHLFAPEKPEQISPPTHGIPRFLFLGRIVPEKGLTWLLRTLPHLTVPIHLDIAGEGYQEMEMHDLAEKLRLGDRVTFHGWVSPEQVNQLIANARALIFPSLWHEPGGTVAFEAMSSSRAVIMSRVGGMPEVIQPGVNGLLVGPNDIKGLAASIEQLATDWALATQLGKMGRKLATEQFTLQNHVAELMQLYQRTFQSQQLVQEVGRSGI
jgi:glycosyltransferase involved in cell wall biosynthesis